MKRIEFIYLLTGFCTICSCTSKANSEIKEVITEVHNTVTEAITEIVEKDIKPEDIRLDKELLYDKHTLKCVCLFPPVSSVIKTCFVTHLLFRVLQKSFRKSV